MADVPVSGDSVTASQQETTANSDWHDCAVLHTQDLRTEFMMELHAHEHLEMDPLFVRKVHAIAGVMSGAAGVFAGHALDTVKVRLQTQPQGSAALYRGTFHCFRTIVKNEGITGLYKGMSSPLASLALVNAMVFSIYSSILRHFGENNATLGHHFVAGCAAAAPSERLKLLMQIQYDQAHTQYRSPFHAAKKLVKKQGFKSLNRGYLATLVRDCPAFGIYFSSYEWLSKKMSKDGKVQSLTTLQLLLAGGTSGMLSWLFNYPTDVVKTRFQADNSYKGYWDCIRRTFATGGIKSFYVGIGSTLIRSFPSNAATFFTVEWSYRLLLDNNIFKVGSSIERKTQEPTVSMTDLWIMNCLFILPEAGSTSLDPMIHGCRFF